MSAISTVFFLAVQEKNYGGVFLACITELLTILAGFAFVGDTSLLQTQRLSTEKMDDIVEELQGFLDICQGTLHSSGGVLDCNGPRKFYWYGVEY